MPLKELPADIWLKILEFVQRPTPPPHRATTWSQLRQHDLATVSRVSSTFHDLACALLYRHVTAPDLPLLLQGLLADPAHPRRSTNKLELMKHTTTLHIAYSGPPLWPSDVLLSLLAGGDWAVIGMPAELLGLRLDQVVSNHQAELTDALVALPHDLIAMPALQHVILGLADDEGMWLADWASYTQAGWDCRVPTTTVRARELLTAFLLRNRPDHICVTTPHGPYVPSLHPDDMTPDIAEVCRDLDITTHYRHTLGPLALIPGALHRFFVDPGVCIQRRQVLQMLIPELSHRPIIHGIGILAESFEEHPLYSQTRIITYGTSRAAMTEWDPGFDTLKEAISHNRTLSESRIYEGERSPKYSEALRTAITGEAADLGPANLLVQACMRGLPTLPALMTCPPIQVEIESKQSAPQCDSCGQHYADRLANDGAVVWGNNPLCALRVPLIARALFSAIDSSAVFGW